MDREDSVTLEDTPSGGGEEGLGSEDVVLLKVLFQRNRALERLEAGCYESPDHRTADAVLVALPELLGIAGEAVEHLATHQTADELRTIEEGPDDVIRRHPELTAIPVDAFRTKGSTLGVRPPEEPT
ncbi:hypothetical protein ACFV6G_00460 [Streptomyces lavendulae]|uniref:hypothetical protein n=1 Tax=Streptomyces lavendulae TaxID=1914 RepID=UPI0036C67788